MALPISCPRKSGTLNNDAPQGDEVSPSEAPKPNQKPMVSAAIAGEISGWI